MILRETRTTDSRPKLGYGGNGQSSQAIGRSPADNLWTYLAEIPDPFRYNRRSRKPEIFNELVTHFSA